MSRNKKNIDPEAITLCMIVRNEADVLAKSIQSVKHFVNEMIILDTGSTDNTRELVLDMGAQLFRYEWDDDLAQARNYALKLVSMPWVLVLDADEVLETVDPEYLQFLLKDPAAEGYFLNIINLHEDETELSRDQVVRLFRNKPDYRFEGAIHEQIAPSILRYNRGLGLKQSKLTLKHSGYTASTIRQKDKISRNMRIIKEQLLDNPDNKFLHYCLGLEYYQQGKIKEGITQLHKALCAMQGSEGYFEDVLLNIGSGYLKLNQWNNLMEFVERALTFSPENPNLLILRGFARLGFKDLQSALNDLKSALNSGEITLISKAKIYALMGDLANLQGEITTSSLSHNSDSRQKISKGTPKYISQAIDYYLRSLQSTPNDLYSLCQIIGLWQKYSELFELEKVVEFIPLDNKLKLYQELTSKQEEYQALATLLIAFCIYGLVEKKAWEPNLPLLINTLHKDLNKLYAVINNKSLSTQPYLAKNQTAKLIEEPDNTIVSSINQTEKRKLLDDLLLLTVKELKTTGRVLTKFFPRPPIDFDGLQGRLDNLLESIKSFLLLYIKACLQNYSPNLILPSSSKYEYIL